MIVTALSWLVAFAVSVDSTCELAKADVKPRQKALVFMGDSVTAGYGLAAKEAYPALIAKKLEKAGLSKSWKVVNAGVSGDTTAGGVARLDWVFKLKPDLLFLCLGANDGLRGLKLSETEKNLRLILQRSKNVGAVPLLAGMHLPGNYGADYGKGFSDIYPRLARDFKLPFLPFLMEGMAMKAEFTQADGIHPNAQGAEKIAETVWSFLEPILKEQKN